MSIYDKNTLLGLANEKSADFLTICPRNKKYLDYNVKPIALKVVRGLSVTPDVNIKVNRLNEGKQYVNTSGKEDRFKITVAINVHDTITGDYRYEYIAPAEWDWSNINNMTGLSLETLMNDENLNTGGGYVEERVVTLPFITVFDYWIKTATPLSVVTDAIDIPDDYYVIISNGSRKQEHDDYVYWDLEFIRHSTFQVTNFKNDNTNVQKAITAHNKKTQSKKDNNKTKTSQTTTLKNKLKKCDYKKLVYSKTKKTSNCVKVMQKLLVHYSCLKNTSANIDGWYGKVTVEAVKKFQKKYKTKYKLKQTGKIDKATWKALYTGGSSAVQIGKTIQI